MSQSNFKWRRETILFALFLIPLLWVLSIQVPADGSAGAVFEPVPNDERNRQMAKETVRQGQLIFNPSALVLRASTPLELALFDDVVIAADFIRTDQFENGGQVWVGEDPDSPFSEILLAWNGKGITGHIQTGGDIYRIGPDPQEKGVHLVELLSRDFRPIGLNALEPDYAATPVPYTPPVGANSTQDDTVVDVLVVYTSAAKDEIGGTDAIQNMINMAVAQTNTSYDSSDVSVDINLVHQQEVSFNESGSSPNDLIEDLSSIRSNSEINALREEHYADLVAVIRKDAGAYCGIAYVMNPTGLEFADSAYSLITRTCAVANLSFAHETGHNFGAQHDRNNSGGADGAYSFSHGYQYTGSNSFRTIMGYQSGCPWPCTRIGHWSNNNIFYQGQATGINQHFSNSAANYQTLNYSAPIVANFRELPATPTPTPTNTPTNTHTPTPTNTPTNTPTPTPTFTPTPLPTVVATAPPNQDSVIEWNDFSFEFPSGTFTETVEITILALNPADLPNQPEEGFDTTNYQYQVSAVNVDTRAPIDIVLGQDFTVTIEYDDKGIRRVKEQTLGLFYWDPAETMWVLAPNQDFRENVSIGADGSSLTYFAVLGEETEKAFFPFISRPHP